jgi:hypothetical protein
MDLPMIGEFAPLVIASSLFPALDRVKRESSHDHDSTAYRIGSKNRPALLCTRTLTFRFALGSRYNA